MSMSQMDNANTHSDIHRTPELAGCYFCSKFSNFRTNSAAARFMPKTIVKIAWHEPYDIPTSSFEYTITNFLDRWCYVDLQTTIVLFTRNLSSHKTDWILSELPLPVLYCHLNRRLSSLEGECLCRCEISINIKKSFIVIFVLLCLIYPCSIFVACLHFYPFFILMLLL